MPKALVPKPSPIQCLLFFPIPDSTTPDSTTRHPAAVKNPLTSSHNYSKVFHVKLKERGHNYNKVLQFTAEKDFPL